MTFRSLEDINIDIRAKKIINKSYHLLIILLYSGILLKNSSKAMMLLK